jgi:hypothetical protein
VALESASELGLVNNSLTVVGDSAVYQRDDIAGYWRHVEDYTPAFATYRTAIAGAGFRPSRLVDQLGNVWHFSATQTIDATTGLPEQFPVYRVEDSSGREVVPTTELDSVVITSGKPILVGTKVFFFYLENWVVSSTTVALKCAEFNAASPTDSPTITVFWASPGASTVPSGFDVKVTSDGDGLVFWWGSKLNGASEAVAVARLDATSGLPSAAIVYGTFSDSKRAFKGGCLFREPDGTVSEYLGGSYIGGVTHFNDGVNDHLEVVLINKSTLASSFHQVTQTRQLNGASQLGGVVDPETGNWDLYLGDCVDFIGGSATATETQSISRFSMPAGGGSTTELLILQGGWLVADPLIDDDRVLLVVGHDTVLSYLGAPRLSAQRSYSLYDASGSDTIRQPLARGMYEAGGGDCDGLAGSQATGGYLAPAVIDGTTVVLNVNACRDGVADFYTAELRFELAPVLGPPIQFDLDWLLPGGYPMLIGNWGSAVELGPQFFPDDITVTAESPTGGMSYSGDFAVAAVYVLVTPDGREIESQPSDIKPVTTSSEFIRVVVPTCKQVRSHKILVRVYSTTDAGSTLFRQTQQANDPLVESVTFDLQTPGIGASLYTEGGVSENAPCPPFKVGMLWDNRLFLSGLSEKGIVYASKFIRAGKLPELYFEGRFGIGDYDVTAMGAIDKNHAAIFHSGGISVITRGGPTDTGAGPYEPSHLSDAEIRCSNPRSVCTTPEGCVFQGDDGCIYLLTKGFQVIYIGSGVDDYRADLITSAVFITREHHLRLTTSTRVLVFDFERKPATQVNPEDTLGQWYDWPVAFDSSAVAATTIDGVHFVLGSNGKVWLQDPGRLCDGDDGFIGMKLRLPLTLSGISGYLRCLRGVLVSKWVGAHQIQLTIEADGNTFQPPAKSLTTATSRVDFRPHPSKAGYFLVTIEELQEDEELNKGFKFEGLGLSIQRQPGLGRTTSRLTD